MFFPFLFSSKAKPFSPFLITLLAGGSLILGGCSSGSSKSFAPQCPHVEVLKNAADYYNHQSGSSDLSNLITRANIASLHGDCGYANEEKTAIATRLSLKMTIQQGPAAKSRTINIPYFVAVLHNGSIQNKYEYSQEITFPENISQISASTKLVKISLPISDTLNVEGYQIEVGFQLTEEQLNYNMTHILPPTFKPFQ
ncbi:hypothetical protein [Entomobacter blattae]|uniref:Uncharacterized protein n=1 Tax=Entomobacter blattae TaxID=2762277 RepID=A0A7H1NNJ0_9PROT|nr:hypothetical protein [Entomobacter blattae]QNT77350.1 hypothetical protein JGUZn3_00830 [Entomobacter blattae]